jgi:D-tyrosyl-tRNA(Tyr) deacylase
VARTDSEAEADYMVNKILGLRIFPDEAGKMNRSVRDAGGGLLVVSQFTLYGETSRGRRPSFDAAASADQARVLYEYFVHRARQLGMTVETGIFQAMMTVHIENDGPVTLICETPSRK